MSSRLGGTGRSINISTASSFLRLFASLRFSLESLLATAYFCVSADFYAFKSFNSLLLRSLGVLPPVAFPFLKLDISCNSS